MVYKRILAVVLCLALLAVIVPSTAFAERVRQIVDEHKSGDVIPGEVNLLLKEQYYTIDGPYLDLREILPEIEIDEYRDIMLSVIITGKTPKEELDDECLADVGRQFGVTLKEKTVEAAVHAAELLNSNPYVKWAGPNVYLELADTTPNDPLYNHPDYTPQWGLMKIDAPEAWDYVTGSNTTDGSELGKYVRVAVIDTGVYDQHPDLVNNVNMSLAYNAYSDEMGNTSDTNGHGTHVAGIIGAEGNNDIGVVGVCWNVEIIPIKITYGSSRYSNAEAITAAIDYARNKRIKIANLSFSLGYDQALLDSIEAYSNNGGLLVIAAGNGDINGGIDIDGVTVYQELNNIDGVVIVSALDYDMTGDYPYTDYNFGDEVVDLYAPGISILSTVPYSVDQSGYKSLNGTSMAAPFVAGTAALLKAANTMLTADDIIEAILDNVVTSSNLTNYCSTGGRLSIPDALYSLGYQVIISNTMTHGTVRPSAVFTNPNTIVYLTAYPDAGYMLKPGTMKHNSNNTVQISKWRCFCAMPYSNDTITAQFYMVGDTDFDEEITVNDSLLALRHYSGQITLTGDALLAADVDGDGDVDLIDAQTIQNYAAHIIDHFPIEE